MGKEDVESGWRMRAGGRGNESVGEGTEGWLRRNGGIERERKGWEIEREGMNGRRGIARSRVKESGTVERGLRG